MIKKILKKIILYYKHRGNIIISYNNLAVNCKLNNCILDKEVMVSSYAHISNTRIGYLSSIGRYSKIVHTSIGKYCAVSWDTTINAISHPHNHLTMSAFPYVPYVGNFVKERKQTYQKVIIKNDVWIGANSVIMPGISIGNGAIIGAGAVVTKDVPDYAIVVGVPAKVIKYRFSPEIIEQLLLLKWWDLNPELIKKNISVWQGKFNQSSLVKLENLCK